MKLILTLLAILYALSPYDGLPDFLIGWGWLDDLFVLGLLWWYLSGRFSRHPADPTDAQSSTRAHTTEEGVEPASNGAWDPFAVLGLPRGAPPDEITRAYRELAGKYHPDKVMHLGEEFRELAEKRFKDIQRAYDELRRRA